jgi:L-fuconolactonase
MMIDAHCHLWRIGQAGCVWPDSNLPRLHRDFTIEDWRREAPPAARCILVQSQEAEVDTLWLLDLADQHDDVVGVVGWVDMLADDAPERIAALAAASPWLKSIRPMVQDKAADWFASQRLDRAAAAMQAAGLRLDALVRPCHLAALSAFAERHPDLPIVINHAAKPGADLLPTWRKEMARLAALPHVVCKLSGLLTEVTDPAPAVATGAQVLALFGPRRVMWGSDWPVLQLAGTYAGWLAMARRIVPLCDHAAVFGGNAARFYGVSR